MMKHFDDVDQFLADIEAGLYAPSAEQEAAWAAEEDVFARMFARKAEIAEIEQDLRDARNRHADLIHARAPLAAINAAAAEVMDLAARLN